LSIPSRPKPECLREKLRVLGPRALCDAEILAIFLRAGTRNHTPLELACELLAEFGDLRSLLDAGQIQFCQARGLGKARYAELRACLEIARRYL